MNFLSTKKGATIQAKVSISIIEVNNITSVYLDKINSLIAIKSNTSKKHYFQEVNIKKQ